MRSMLLVALVGATLLLIVVATLVAWQGSDRSARAAPALVVGFDMDPTGNSCPGDGGTDCTLGTIDTCVRVPSGGGVVTIDVFLDGLPSGGDFLSFEYVIWERNDLTVGTVTGVTHADQFANLIYQKPPLSALVDNSLATPTPLVGWYPSVVDLGGGLEANPPFTKGVLSRLDINIPAGTPNGVYGLTIFTPIIGDSNANNYCDPGSPNYVGCDLLDALKGYGLIAVGVDCSSGPPVITPTPTPTPPGPAPTATPSPTPATPTPVPPDLVAGWNYACYLGAALPISEALADIMPNVLAIYRLRPDQSYDKWFPGRPELSTITALNSYEALFILTANDAAWPQISAAAPPTDLDLAQGWNSACYSGQTKDVQSATAGIAGQYDALYLLAAGQGWKRFMPARPEIGNLDQLQRFAAVLILVTQPEGAHWVFEP